MKLPIFQLLRDYILMLHWTTFHSKCYHEVDFDPEGEPYLKCRRTGRKYY